MKNFIISVLIGGIIGLYVMIHIAGVNTRMLTEENQRLTEALKKGSFLIKDDFCN